MSEENETTGRDGPPERQGGSQLADQPTTGGPIRYSVNGELLRTDKAVLTVEEILRRAGSAAGIDLNALSEYVLENVANDETYRDLADEAQLEDGDQFLAVYRGRTPVA